MENPKEAADIALGREPEVPPTQPEPSEESGSEGSGLGLRDMLAATTPDKSPADVSGQLDFSTPWFNHAELALEKATGAKGTPAWVNLLTAVVLLMSQKMDLPTPGEPEPSEGSGESDSGESDSGAGDLIA